MADSRSMESLRLTLAGGLLGLVGVVLPSRLIRPLLFNVHPLNPLVLTAGIVLVVASGMVAVVLPAFWASQIDAADVLRSE